MLEIFGTGTILELYRFGLLTVMWGADEVYIVRRHGSESAANNYIRQARKS